MKKRASVWVTLLLLVLLPSLALASEAGHVIGSIEEAGKGVAKLLLILAVIAGVVGFLIWALINYSKED